MIKSLYKIIPALISGILIFISCCTEKDCDRDIFPQITVNLHQPANEDFVFEHIYILEKENQKIIDSRIHHNKIWDGKSILAVARDTIFQLFWLY